MKLNNKLFSPGKVVYNVFNIDFNMEYSKQMDNLNEDLLQVVYEKNYILDIGWYPELDEKGAIIIQIVHNNNWNKPIYKKEVKNKDELIEEIEKVRNIIMCL